MIHFQVHLLRNGHWHPVIALHTIENMSHVENDSSISFGVNIQSTTLKVDCL